MNSNATEVVDLNIVRLTREIETYIKNTKCPENTRYDISSSIWLQLGEMAYSGKVFEALILMKRYAHAKGYRQAKAEKKENR